MNKQAVIDHLATEVMGWHREDRETRAYWFDSDGNAHATVDKPAKFLSLFNPFENAEDALRVLDQFEWYRIEKNTDATGYVEYTVTIEGMWENSMIGPDKLLVITIAAARASGYEE